MRLSLFSSHHPEHIPRLYTSHHHVKSCNLYTEWKYSKIVNKLIHFNNHLIFVNLKSNNISISSTWYLYWDYKRFGTYFPFGLNRFDLPLTELADALTAPEDVAHSRVAGGHHHHRHQVSQYREDDIVSAQ